MYIYIVVPAITFFFAIRSLLFSQTQLDIYVMIGYTRDMGNPEEPPTFAKVKEATRQRLFGTRPFVKSWPLCDMGDLYSRVRDLKLPSLALRRELGERVGIEHVYENGVRTDYRQKNEWMPKPVLNVYPSQADKMFKEGAGTFCPGDWIVDNQPTGVVRYLVLKEGPVAHSGGLVSHKRWSVVAGDFLEPMATAQGDVGAWLKEATGMANWGSGTWPLTPLGPTMGTTQASRIMHKHMKPGERVTIHDIDGVTSGTYLVVEEGCRGHKAEEEADMNFDEYVMEMACKMGLDEDQRDALRKIRRGGQWQDRFMLLLLVGEVAKGLVPENLGHDED